MKKNKVTNLDITHSQIGGFGSRLEMLEAISATLNYMLDYCSRSVHIYRFAVSYKNQFIENLDEALESVLQAYRKSMSDQKLRMEFLWTREYGTYLSDRMPVHHVTVFVQGDLYNGMKIKTRLDLFMRSKFKGGDYTIALYPPKKFCINEGMKVKKGFASKTDAMQWLKGLAHQDGRCLSGYQRSYGYSEGYQKKSKQPIAS